MKKYAKKIQVLLTEREYEILKEIASRQKKEIGAVAHEAIEECGLKKGVKITKTIDRPLFAPEDYKEWEANPSREYSCFGP